MSTNVSEHPVSAIYDGTVRHRRFTVRNREFTYPVGLLYLDLDELPTLLGGRLCRRSPGLIRFRRKDFHRPEIADLASAIKDTVKQEAGITVEGPIRLLAQLRSFGVSFNPVSFYYCFDPSGRELVAVVAEVTNTPWRERHAYVLKPSTDGRVLTDEFDKQLHVSPFMGMDHRYRARLTAPAQTASVHLANWSDSASDPQLLFDATVNLRRHELTRESLRKLARRYPLGGVVRVIGLIYRQGVAIRLQGIRNFPHPPAPSRRIQAGTNDA
jgi:DUF1365 family protein